MDLQHLRVKLPFTSDTAIDLERVIRIFHAWIRDGVRPEILIDVADYRHVHEGPAVLLVAHEADYGVDRTDGAGLFYLRKDAPGGTSEERVAQALRSVLETSLRFEQELDGAVGFDTTHVEIAVNDRLVAPNTAESFDAVARLIGPVLERLFGSADFTLEHATASEPRSLLTLVARGGTAYDRSGAIDRLAETS